MPLSHSSPDCTGRWGVRTVNGGSYWKCDLCGALGAISVRNHAAAVRENAMGLMLDCLTRAGRRLLDTDGTVP